MGEAMQLLWLIVVTKVCVTTGLVGNGNSIHSDEETDSDLLASFNPQEDVCKYKKGEWSSCNLAVMLITRKDTLKPSKSSTRCEKTRVLTRRCPDTKNDGVCVF